MNDAALSPPGAWARLRRNRAATIAMIILAIVVGFALFGPLLLRTDPHTTTGEQFQPPSGRHFFGTDVNGRDVFARVIEGARISLLVGLSGAMISFFIGTSYGLVAGYVGGKTDALMMRFVEILYAIPRLIIIIIASFIFDPIVRAHLAHVWGGALVGYSKIGRASCRERV